MRHLWNFDAMKAHPVEAIIFLIFFFLSILYSLLYPDPKLAAITGFFCGALLSSI